MTVDASMLAPVDALTSLIDAVVQRVMVGIRTNVPATVTAFSRSPRAEVSVTVGVQARLRSGEYVTIGSIDRVPVLWPAGGGWTTDADLVPGDEVMLTVFDRDIAEWLDKGGPAHPGSGRLHNVSSSACMAVSLRSLKDVAAAVPGVGTYYIGTDSGDAPWLRLRAVPPSATVEAPAISLGDGATLGVARLTDTVAANVDGAALLTAIQVAIAAIVAVPPINANTAAVNAAAAVLSALPTGLTGLGVISGASTIVRAK